MWGIVKLSLHRTETHTNDSESELTEDKGLQPKMLENWKEIIEVEKKDLWGLEVIQWNISYT